MPPVLILGIGNTLLGDEGAGVHALQRLLADADNGTVELMDAGTLGFNLLPTLEVHPRLIVLDAAELDAPAGTVRVFEGSAMDSFLCSAAPQRARSRHLRPGADASTRGQPAGIGAHWSEYSQR